MRILNTLALIIVMVFVGLVVVDYIAPDTTPIDSVITVADPAVTVDGTVMLWTAPNGPPIVLASMLTSDQDVQVTDLGGSATAGVPVAIEDYYKENHSNYANLNTWESCAIPAPRYWTFKVSVTDLVA